MWLTLRCPDIQALDILSAIQAPDVRLRRTIINPYRNVPEVSGDRMLLSDPRAGWQVSHGEGTMSYISTAVWWATVPLIIAENDESRERRVLQGELHLKPSIQPTTHIGHYRLFVSV